MPDIRHIWEVVINLNRIKEKEGTRLLHELYMKHKKIEKKKGVPVELVVRFSKPTRKDINKAVECYSDPELKEQMKAEMLEFNHFKEL